MNLNRALIIIGACVGGFIVLYVLIFSIILPYFDARTSVQAAIAKAEFQHQQDTDLIVNQPKVKKAWADLLAGNLKTQTDTAQEEISNALSDWARLSRFPVQSVNSSRPVQIGDFQQISFQLVCLGTSQAMSRFILYIEKTDLPLRIDKLTVNAPKDGINDLRVSLTVSTTVYSPVTKTAAKPASNSGGIE